MMWGGKKPARHEATGNVESDPRPVHTSPTRLNFGEGAGDSDGLEEKTVLF